MPSRHRPRVAHEDRGPRPRASGVHGGCRSGYPKGVPAPTPAHEVRRPRARLAQHDEGFRTALNDTVGAFERGALDYVLIGGIASTALGRVRPTHDIDVFVRPEDAQRALAVLACEGFETEETFPERLYKAYRGEQLVDVIFRSAGGIYLDDEMLARAPVEPFDGRQVRLIPPEDLVVIKAIVHAEHMPRHWHDAVSVVGTAELDWDYLLLRARHGVRRVLSLLLYAQSVDLAVPSWAVDRLYALVRDGR